jgi:hypothetical protein
MDQMIQICRDALECALEAPMRFQPLILQFFFELIRLQPVKAINF